jgi:glutamate--cysteine ligase
MIDELNIKVPHLTTALTVPLEKLEKHLLLQQLKIESWFREQWHNVPLLFYSSVDLRNEGFKISQVDTNLFPAGFNNLNPEFLPLCIQAVQTVMEKICPRSSNVLIIPESHTRHQFYFEHLASLSEILTKAGYNVRIGSLLDEIKTAREIQLPSGKSLKIEPIQRKQNRLYVDEFSPCVILLNNDLASGVPEILQNVEQIIIPPLTLGWSNRSKSEHFKQYELLSTQFAQHIEIDPWLIAPYFSYCDHVNFMTGEGQENLIKHAEKLFEKIKKKYAEYQIKHPPFIVIKADSGTYGMAVMTLKNIEEIRNLNRKQRQNMAATKGGLAVTKVILQEGIYTFETWGEQQAVAEPVVYMIGRHVVGGFYRVHANKSIDENLNAPGMNFEPLAFAEACNNPCDIPQDCSNRFYAYGVVARLAMLAACMELKNLENNK